MKQNIDVLLGLQWGDEGKGKIVDVLTPKYDVVARFQGGPNAGHTLEFNGKKCMVLGDVYPQNTAALAKIYKESLKADIVQTAHHGYDNTDAAQVYEYIQASMVMWTVAGYEKDSLDLVNAPVNAIFKNIPSNMQFTPVGQNIDFDENWNMAKKYSVMNDIPYCDCAYCKTAAIGPIKSSGNKQTANNK